jgi:subtilase family serine protease
MCAPALEEDALALVHLIKRRHLAVAFAAGTATSMLAVFAAAVPASSATTPGPGGRMAVPQGVGPAALKGARVLGPTAAGTKERLSFILKANSVQQLEVGVELGIGHGYLSVSQFADRYGQPAGNVSSLQDYLAKYGIKTSAYADRLDVSATGTAAEFNAALGVTQQSYFVPAVPTSGGQARIPAQHIHGTTDAATLPGPIARFVLCVLGLTSYGPYTSNATHTLAAAPSAKADSSVSSSQTPEDFAKNYGLDPLYAKSYNGSGQTIGIVTLASVNPKVPYHFWRKTLGIKAPPGRITLNNVDGGAGPVSLKAGSDETTLDVEQSGALAPGAHIDVYQAPNTDPGFADAFYDAASQNVADSVSVSWGSSETVIAALVSAHQETSAYLQAFDQAFLELAAQGQSMFASGGDGAAYDAHRDLGTTNLSNNSPGGSPFVTSAGGTTLPGTVTFSLSGGTTKSITIPAQRDWGWDWLWPLWQDLGYTTEATFAEKEVVGGGGGYSTAYPTPLYQEGTRGTHTYSAVQYLTPTDYQDVDGLTLPTAWNFNGSPSVTTGIGTGRAVPDISADADPYTGYEIYDPQFGSGSAALEGGWGGTSFVAPQLNGSAAVIDSYVGGRTGFWNPAIYRFANRPGSPFTPLGATGTSDDNLYYTGTAGQTYNVGSGLGIPDISRLAADFAGQDSGHGHHGG